MFPQVSRFTSTIPRNAIVAWVRIAKIMAKMNCETMMASSFGRISTRMIRQARSPEARAASTYSRLRTLRVCALSTRAEAAQLVSAMTRMSAVRLPCFTYANVTMISGNVGITRMTLDSRDSASSTTPPM
jgi:hypothetical protein